MGAFLSQRCAGGWGENGMVEAQNKTLGTVGMGYAAELTPRVKKYSFSRTREDVHEVQQHSDAWPAYACLLSGPG
jgi:hypothetical protein